MDGHITIDGLSADAHRLHSLSLLLGDVIEKVRGKIASDNLDDFAKIDILAEVIRDRVHELIIGINSLPPTAHA